MAVSQHAHLQLMLSQQAHLQLMLSQQPSLHLMDGCALKAGAARACHPYVFFIQGLFSGRNSAKPTGHASFQSPSGVSRQAMVPEHVKDTSSTSLPQMAPVRRQVYGRAPTCRADQGSFRTEASMSAQPDRPHATVLHAGHHFTELRSWCNDDWHAKLLCMGCVLTGPTCLPPS